MAAAAAAAWLCAAAASHAQTTPASEPAAPSGPAAPPRVDAQSQAVLFGAAYAQSDLAADRAGGMIFLPGRGLIRWQTEGKTIAEQEELKTEAIGLADARAVQAEIDARAAASLEVERAVSEADAVREHLHLVADARSVPALRLNQLTGTQRHAGGVVPLNHAAKAQIAAALGVHDGATFKDRNRLYLFGAVSGRGVGMNLLHDSMAGWKNGGLSTDKGGFIGQRQAGLAWRRGNTQAALSYVQEKTRAQILGITSIKDHRLMLNLSVSSKPPPAPPPPP